MTAISKDDEIAEPSPDAPAVPVFPLPNAVFFPDTVLPLHVFEHRYRAMIADVTQGDGKIAITLLRPGYQKNYEGNPAIHTVGTLGRVEGLEQLRDGRYNLRLVGERRVRIGAMLVDRPYRVHAYRPLADAPVDESTESILEAKTQLLATQTYVMREIQDSVSSMLVFSDRMSFAAAVNGACANLPLEPAIRQRLLEIDDLRERGRVVAELLDEVLQRLLELKRDPSEDDGEGGILH